MDLEKELAVALAGVEKCDHEWEKEGEKKGLCKKCGCPRSRKYQAKAESLLYEDEIPIPEED